MLALTKIGHADGMEGVGYLVDEVGTDSHDYYAGVGIRGVWSGSGAASLGLEGEVEREAFVGLLEGASPVDGSRLEGRRRGPKRSVLGWDLTFSAPKSVSVVWGVSEPSVRRRVALAHDRAVADALQWMERHGARSRRGAGGSDVVPVSGVVGGRFQHRTSRLGDPQLHTHVAVANLARVEGDEWRTLFGARLFGHARACGHVYQASLRREVGRELGVSFGPVENGLADIAGFPADARLRWSSRRAEISARAERLGWRSPRSLQFVAYGTRAEKERGIEADEERLHQRWMAEAEEIRFDVDRVLRASGEDVEADSDREVRDLLPAVFTARDVAVAVAGSSRSGLSGGEIDRAVAAFLGEQGAVWADAEGREVSGTVRLRGGRLVVGDANEPRYALASR